MTQQAFFDFLARPFQAPPQEDVFVPLEPMTDAISRLCEAAVKGDGIGVLTAGPGAGKTVVCQQVQARLAGDYATVLLPSCRFPTRRAMLQSILHSMGCEYVGLSEQESLLKLLDVAQSMLPERGGVVLIADEAHQLGTRLLEELRCLTNHVENGQPLIRVLLSGQLALEELLTQPELHSLNYRITCHTTLEPLSMQQSARYVDERLARVGGDACSLFGDDALEMVCRISDGSPRCLNQLADACLTHAAETGQRTVDARMVRLVLRDLKQLPLQWNESACDQIDEEDHASLASPLSMEDDDLSLFDDDPVSPETEDEHPIQGELEEDRAATETCSQEPEWMSNVVTIEVGGDDDRSDESDPADDTIAVGGEPTVELHCGPDRGGDDLRPETSVDPIPLARFPAESIAAESNSIIDFGAATEEAMFGSVGIGSEEIGSDEIEETDDIEATTDERSLLPSLEVTIPLASAGQDAEGGDVDGFEPVGLRLKGGQLEERDIIDRYAALDRNAEASQQFDEADGMTLALDWTGGMIGHDVPAKAGSPAGSPLENMDRVIQAVSDAVATEIARDRGLSPAELDEHEPQRAERPTPSPQLSSHQPGSQDSGAPVAEARQAGMQAPRWRATPDPAAFDVIEPDSSVRSEDTAREIQVPQIPTLSQPATGQLATTAEATDNSEAELEPMVGLGELPGDSDDRTENLQRALDALLAELRQASKSNSGEHRIDQPTEASAPRGSRERPYARLFSRARRVRSRT